jgi:hypothetical protein
MPGLYAYNSARKLFEKLIRDFTAFGANPSDDGLFAVIFTLYHLREWICPGEDAHKRIRNKPQLQRSREERLYATLHDMEEYKVVRALCNNAKHFEGRDGNLDDRTDKISGARAGMMRAGDSLSVTHFTVDGMEIRTILAPVFMIYFKYFQSLTN